MPSKSLRLSRGTAAVGVLMLTSCIGALAQQPAKPAPAAEAPSSAPATASTGAAQQAQAPAPAEAAKPAEYVGSETCKACHEEIFNNLQKTPHFAIETGARRG